MRVKHIKWKDGSLTDRFSMRVVPRDDRISRPWRVVILSGGFLYPEKRFDGGFGFSVPHLVFRDCGKKRSVLTMEFMTGATVKETLEIGELPAGDFAGKRVKVNGVIHTIRNMGEVAFIVLRKREGLLQCVCEMGAWENAVCNF